MQESLFIANFYCFLLLSLHTRHIDLGLILWWLEMMFTQQSLEHEWFISLWRILGLTFWWISSLKATDLMPHWRHSKTHITKRIYLNCAFTILHFWHSFRNIFLHVQSQSNLLKGAFKGILKWQERRGVSGINRIIMTSHTIADVFRHT
jgi:hypothetical protein